MNRPCLSSSRPTAAAAGGGTRRRRLVAAAAAAPLLLWALSGCADLPGSGPMRYTLSASELQSLVQRSFPQERRLAEVVDVKADSATVRLIPERNRLGAVVDLHARDRVFGSRWSGRLDFDSQLRWDAADKALKLQDVRVQDFKLLDAPLGGSRPGGNTPPPPGSTSALAGGAATEQALRSGGDAVQRVVGLAVERMLEGMPLVKLDAQRQAQLERLGVTPGEIRITAAGVEITFAPAAR